MARELVVPWSRARMKDGTRTSVGPRGSGFQFVRREVGGLYRVGVGWGKKSSCPWRLGVIPRDLSNGRRFRSFLLFHSRKGARGVGRGEPFLICENFGDVSLDALVAKQLAHQDTPVPGVAHLLLERIGAFLLQFFVLIIKRLFQRFVLQ